MYSNSDILDQPETSNSKPNRAFVLIYIELSFLIFFGLLSFFGFSLLVAPIFILCMLIYAAVVPFLKPQFTKGKSLRILLGIWNLLQIALLGTGALFIMQSWPNVYQLLVSGLLGLAMYYLILPFVESHAIKSKRFFTLLPFGIGFSAFFIGIIFKLNNWPYAFSLLTTGPILVCTASLMILFQLAKNREAHRYYWFYLPRVAGLLISWFIAIFGA